MKKFLVLVVAAGFLLLASTPSMAGKNPCAKKNPCAAKKKKSVSTHPFPEKKQKGLYQSQIGKWGGP